MIDKAKEVLKDVWKLQFEQVELVSGGAAWSGEQSICVVVQNLRCIVNANTDNRLVIYNTMVVDSIWRQ